MISCRNLFRLTDLQFGPWYLGLSSELIIANLRLYIQTPFGGRNENVHENQKHPEGFQRGMHYQLYFLRTRLRSLKLLFFSMF